MYDCYDWDSIFEYYHNQTMDNIRDEDYAYAYAKSQADLKYVSE